MSPAEAPKLVTPGGAPIPSTAATAATSVPLATASCDKCGARRPKEEIESKACSNCGNLELIQQELDGQAQREAANAEAQAEGKEALKNLPDLDKTASALYDDERGVVWVGFNLKDEKLDPVGLLLMIDQAKHQILAFLIRWKQAEAKKRSKIVRVVESVGVMMDRLRGKQTGKSPLLKP